MLSVTVIILHAFGAQAIAKEDDRFGEVIDNLISKLADKVSLRVPLRNSELDGTTLGKAHSDMGFGSPMSMRAAQPVASPAVSMAQGKLRAMGFPPSHLETLA